MPSGIGASVGSVYTFPADLRSLSWTSFAASRARWRVVARTTPTGCPPKSDLVPAGRKMYSFVNPSGRSWPFGAGNFMLFSQSILSPLSRSLASRTVKSSPPSASFALEVSRPEKVWFAYGIWTYAAWRVISGTTSSAVNRESPVVCASAVVFALGRKIGAKLFDSASSGRSKVWFVVVWRSPLPWMPSGFPDPERHLAKRSAKAWATLILYSLWWSLFIAAKTSSSRRPTFDASRDSPSAPRLTPFIFSARAFAAIGNLPTAP
mmetsp:Transcript_15000/g.36730  ORF Transcript_15000/g.36730 Transcript_15000/m.36730 type:complete len:264 (-) Transcript_15000:1300-2091(-)